ncbi:MAG TPA: type II toxin-antitoxin system PemK/MazF family toxin [Pyrinomonadaceae bacterium]|nr:type II toxin-antitoxin system PemK/MazF family toxin [Pyrinomonadaceae bacterium]
MVAPSAGSVVLVTFPFSDLTQTKLRPAVVLARASRSDWILCQITSKPYSDSRATEINDNSFDSGSLRLVSYARPGKLFTGNDSLIVAGVGKLKTPIFKEIIETVVGLLREASRVSS